MIPRLLPSAIFPLLALGAVALSVPHGSPVAAPARQAELRFPGDNGIFAVKAGKTSKGKVHKGPRHVHGKRHGHHAGKGRHARQARREAHRRHERREHERRLRERRERERRHRRWERRREERLERREAELERELDELEEGF